ncbi:hypothetical protein ACRUKS_27370 [Burkholderia pseudomallei]|uniref:hypothetical protein n=1 Tax=Burkholderia pseudomallei TaxID=28450 RepID=UPI0003AABCC9|nr:hypothetical protein [Burkholderia pseudomallei]ALC57697.1 hypothetical protein AMS56_13415 [Burkholderia pseudomallei]MDV2113153.1 hypothetical protein [Burkholderia pseudomallei]MDV2145347.1 hypothetical protein [Burkholderia pseudomallei]MDV2175440.1 hypothetical protein [Burkholderia pseudomallei]MDV2181985.1 hypothetical protein [Burkholderia pseudomallei]
MRLTVSPAPLVASGESRNVPVAMTYGESVPRAPVEMACTECDAVDSSPVVRDRDGQLPRAAP